MTRPKGGADPTRRKPGGSRTETKITEASEMGSDNGADGPAPPKADTNRKRENDDERSDG